MFKLIYKPINESSFKTINKYKNEHKINKIGHTGTLDLLAQGLLLVGINDGTKLIPLIENKTKEYKVQMKLGYISKTYDSEGPIEFFSNYCPTKNEINKIINSFCGIQKQIPPIFSAKKINGKRLYEYARKQQQINLKPIEIEIYYISNIEYQYPFISFTTKVSNGTYIRSLINDIGQKLKTGAYMTFLERTMVNGLREKEKINLEKLLNCIIIKVNKKEFKEIIENKFNYQKLNDGKYLLKLKNEIVGYVLIKHNKKEKIKLFGNKLKIYKGL